MKNSVLPSKTLARLISYLRCLQDLRTEGIQKISSEELSQRAGTKAAQLRKDFSYLGEFGVRGVGYNTQNLIEQISTRLGLNINRSAAIVGMGKLGPALLNYKGFPEHGFKIQAAFDKDSKKVGQKVGGIVIRDSSELVKTLKENPVDIGIIATPAEAAQSVANKLIKSGIKAILNFAPAILEVPDGVHLRQVDLSSELQILAFYLQKDEEAKERN